MIYQLLKIEFHNPHHVLGLHVQGGRKVIRLWRPGGEKIYVEVLGKIEEAKRVDRRGLFELEVEESCTLLDYRVYHQDGRLAHDPYSFYPTFGELDAHLLGRGVHYRIYEAMGGRLITHQGCPGGKFALWAPNAKQVSLVGDFNFWNGEMNPMRSMGGSGVWELFIPGLVEGERYKFEVQTADGEMVIKADPYALASEIRPQTASLLFDVDRFPWDDGEWMETRQGAAERALNIYEVHLGSWKKGLGYRELAVELASYCQKMEFSHVELLPIAEHPLDESWGYQVTGFYAVTSRFGTPRDFQFFVDYLHRQKIGVIIDWVPAHFPTDGFSLIRFDGTALYEHEDVRLGSHPHWGTCIFNYGRHEVSNFLIGNALFWFDKMHIDGLRVDAVASMLYLDYGRKEGEWIPNEKGGRENLEAIAFLKHLNSIVHQRFPGVLMCAEESTSFFGVTHSVEGNGLGFDLKWNMGWMNDTLRYFQRDPLYRSHHHHDLTFGLLYAFSEKFILVLSHDEVVHGKGSLLTKMPGDDWQRFGNMRLLYSYMMCQPGKKLLFMGGELGQWHEWNCKGEIGWDLLQYERHQAFHNCIQALNHLYHSHPALWENELSPLGFEWIDFNDKRNSVISYLRKGGGKTLACIHNFTPSYFERYFIRLKGAFPREELLNTDGEKFGGSGKVNRPMEQVFDEKGECVGFNLTLAPLATLLVEVDFE